MDAKDVLRLIIGIPVCIGLMGLISIVIMVDNITKCFTTHQMTFKNRIQWYLLGKTPVQCDSCGGDIIARGFSGHNRRYQCKDCNEIMATNYGF